MNSTTTERPARNEQYGLVASPFKKGDRVVFARRCQNTSAGMVIEEVNATMFDVKLKVDGQWWTPAALAPFGPWEAEYRKSQGQYA